ncbi:MAG: HAD family hydrolase [Bacteroidetes bacterium]|nr:HAD family hydrolase [Bacteroidota bacterium]
MTGIKTIIWDWNGTLLDDMDICVDSINVLLEKRGLPLMDLVTYRRLFTFPVIEYYETIGFDFNAEPYDKVAFEFIDIYLERLKEADLFGDVKPTLDFFKKKQIKQAVLSAMEHENLLKSISSKGIEGYFSVIQGTEDHFAHGKVYQAEKIMKTLGVNPQQTLFVGDTLHDQEVARVTGCHCILTSAGHQSEERLNSGGCRVINGIGELTALFNRI